MSQCCICLKGETLSFVHWKIAQIICPQVDYLCLDFDAWTETQKANGIFGTVGEESYSCLMMVYSAGHVLYKYVGKDNYKSNKHAVIVHVPNINIIIMSHSCGSHSHSKVNKPFQKLNKVIYVAITCSCMSWLAWQQQLCKLISHIATYYIIYVGSFKILRLHLHRSRHSHTSSMQAPFSICWPKLSPMSTCPKQNLVL